MQFWLDLTLMPLTLFTEFYEALGLLGSDKFQIVQKQELVACHIGETPIKVTELLRKLEGGALFVDEAYR